MNPTKQQRMSLRSSAKVFSCYVKGIFFNVDFVPEQRRRMI